MRLDQGKLSLEAREAPFERLLQELSRLGGLKILSDGPLEGRITLKIENVNLDTAMRKILRGKDVTFLYAASKDLGSIPLPGKPSTPDLVGLTG